MQRLAGKGDVSATTFERIVSRLAAANQQVSRIREGQLTVHWALVNLGQLVATVVVRFEKQFAQAGCAVTLELTLAALINGDPSSLDPIITNLLTNALKYGWANRLKSALQAMLSQYHLLCAIMVLGSHQQTSTEYLSVLNGRSPPTIMADLG